MRIWRSAPKFSNFSRQEILLSKWPKLTEIISISNVQTMKISPGTIVHLLRLCFSDILKFVAINCSVSQTCIRCLRKMCDSACECDKNDSFSVQLLDSSLWVAFFTWQFWFCFFFQSKKMFITVDLQRQSIFRRKKLFSEYFILINLGCCKSITSNRTYLSR